MYIFFNIILLIIMCIFSYLIFNLYRKNRKYESLIDEYDQIISDIKEYMQLSLNKLIKIDRQQIFESDDDVGFFFKSLKEEIIKLNNNIAGIFNEETEEITSGTGQKINKN